MDHRAYAALHVKAFSEDGDFVYIEGIASTPTADRVGDRMDPMGAQFKLPMPLLLQHSHAAPVGEVVEAKATPKGITFKARLPIIKEAGKLKDRIDETIHSLKYKLLGFVSIGFGAKGEDMKSNTFGGFDFAKWDWRELSLVVIPAQAQAAITSVKSLEEGEDPIQLSENDVQFLKSHDTNAPAALGSKGFPVVKIDISAGASAHKTKTKSAPKPVEGQEMTLLEQIKAYQATLAEKRASMTAIIQKSADDGTTLDAEQTESFDTLKGECDAITKHIARLEEMEAINVATAKSVKEDDRSGKDMQIKGFQVQAKNTEKLEPGIEFARFAMCKLAAKGNPQMAHMLAKTHYPQNERVVKALELSAHGHDLAGLMKATVEAGTTLDATWAAPLVDYQNFAGDFVEFLRPRTIIGQFGAGNVPSLNRIPFNVRIAGQTSGGNAYWVGEGAPKPLTAFDFNATELRWNKIAAISVLTNELIRFSSPSAERLVRDGLAAAVIERADIDFINPAKAAVANVSPASITNGATAIASSGDTAEDIRVDIQALWAPFIAARNPPRNAVYIMDSTTALALSLMLNPLGQAEFPGVTMNGGTFMGVPVVVSDYLPVSSSGGIVVLVNASDIWLADDGQVTVDMSTEASLQMLDNPTNNSATGTATSVVSMFQTNSTAFRAERYLNWARRRASGVAYLTGVSWGA